MFNLIRKWFRSTGGRVIAATLIVVCLVITLFNVRSFFSRDGPDEQYFSMYICTETGKAFRHENKAGETLPVLSPFSGKNTGRPAEACYWTRQGAPKEKPTWVLLNDFTGNKEPTFCPDCGRLVIGHNPRPGVGVEPPPTADEYGARLAAHKSSPQRSNNP
jgi:hypothetical protein